MTDFATDFGEIGADVKADIGSLQRQIDELRRTGGSGSGNSSSDSRYNVRDYGAAGDGSSADTDEIQAAIDAAWEDGGGVAYLPKGMYKITQELIDREGVSIDGDGRYLSIIYQDDPAEHALNLKGASNLDIANIGITHEHDLAPQDDGQCLYSGQPTENVTVRDCAFVEPARQAVGFWSGDNRNIRIESCNFSRCTRAGVVLFGEGLEVVGCYIRGTGDDAIALNTDRTTNCLVGGNIIIDGAGVGEATGGSIKFHGHNISVVWNSLFRSNQYAIRGQIQGSQSGSGTATSPTRNRIANNNIQWLTDINPRTQTRAAIEMRQFESVAIQNNSVHEIGNKIGILLRNVKGDDTVGKVSGNLVDGAARAVQIEDQQQYIDISDLTAHNVGRVLQIDEPVDSLHFRESTGHNIDDRIVSFGGVDSGRYSIKLNEFTDVDTDNIVTGSMSGGTVHNYLNTPDGAASQTRTGASTYDAVRWSAL